MTIVANCFFHEKEKEFASKVFDTLKKSFFRKANFLFLRSPSPMCFRISVFGELLRNQADSRHSCTYSHQLKLPRLRQDLCRWYRVGKTGIGSVARIRISAYTYMFLDLGVKPIEARRDRGCRFRRDPSSLAALVSRLDHVAPAITKVAGHFHVAATRRTGCFSSPLLFPSCSSPRRTQCVKTAVSPARFIILITFYRLIFFLFLSF